MFCGEQTQEVGDLERWKKASTQIRSKGCSMVKDARFKIKIFEQRENLLRISKVTCYRSPMLAFRVIV
jgi:hypothetical protein